MNRILVIDDDMDINNLLRRFLTKHGYEVETAFSGAEGEKMLSSFDPDLVMCDYRLDDMDGSALLAKIKQQKPELPVIIITGYSDLRTAVKVVRLGAFDYITKPLIPDEILLTIKKALSNKDEEGNDIAPAVLVKTKRTKPQSGYLFSDSVHSVNMEKQINLVAPTNYSVVIYGESGAGKEGVARLIHDRSKRSDKPFVAMDCGAISKELAGSEMFGHEKGAFTGAVGQKIGHFEMANGGTLFLDEVTNLSYDVQALLLRVIQEKTLRRLGSNKEIKVDVRIIVASNEKLPNAVQQGKFREDLYHRLNEFTIEVPSLRDRRQDIVFFANHFLQETALDLEKNLVGFTPEVEDVFMNYPWHGNIRELKNIIKRAALLSSGDHVDIKALPFEILNHNRLEFGVADMEPAEMMNYRHGSAGANGGGSSFATQSPPVSYDAANAKPRLKNAAMEAEYEMILSALNKVNFNKSKAADMLGINRKTLYNKMKQMKFKDK